MARAGENTALQVIYSFFLGLMVLAFIGIGVYTFYPAPSSRYQADIQKLQDRVNQKSAANPTPAQQAEINAVQHQIDALYKKQEANQKKWARNTSIIVILLATAVMAVSLVRSEQLRVVSNGLLMGGLFTMVYGAGLVIYSGDSLARFLVISFAFAITLGLGYAKFARSREERAATPVSAPYAMAGSPNFDSSALSHVVARLDRLEARTAAAAAALGSPSAPAVSEVDVAEPDRTAAPNASAPSHE
jgi:hypothetical protein